MNDDGRQQAGGGGGLALGSTLRMCLRILRTRLRLGSSLRYARTGRLRRASCTPCSLLRSGDRDVFRSRRELCSFRGIQGARGRSESEADNRRRREVRRRHSNSKNYEEPAPARSDPLGVLRAPTRAHSQCGGSTRALSFREKALRGVWSENRACRLAGIVHGSCREREQSGR